jgi:hypothetical protein
MNDALRRFLIPSPPPDDCKGFSKVALVYGNLPLHSSGVVFLPMLLFLHFCHPNSWAVLGSLAIVCSGVPPNLNRTDGYRA